MGYYTDYTLTIEGDVSISDREQQEIVDAIALLKSFGVVGQDFEFTRSDRLVQMAREMKKHTDYAWSIRGDDSLYLIDSKWYDHEKHMIAVSKNHPQLVFILQGEGEESGDIWKKEFHNGEVKVFKAKISFEEE